MCALLETVGFEPYNVLLFHVLFQLTHVTLKHRVEVLFHVEGYTQLLCVFLYYILPVITPHVSVTLHASLTTNTEQQIQYLIKLFS